MRREELCGGWRFFDLTEGRGGVGQEVTLPHDAMIHAPRSADAPSGGEQGNFHGGTYRYERRISLPDGESHRRALVQFGGVYRRAVVSVDGVELARHAYGWSPFFVGLSEALVGGGEHLLSVACDNEAQPDSRYYTGAGIHRPVWLWTGGAACIEPEGVRVTTLSLDPPRVHVEVMASPGSVEAEILDGDVVVARGQSGTPACPSAPSVG